MTHIDNTPNVQECPCVPRVSRLPRCLFTVQCCLSLSGRLDEISIPQLSSVKSQPRTGHTREPDPTHNELKHTIKLA